MPTPSPAAPTADTPKMQTSIDTNDQMPAMVRFRRWTPFGNTAYLRGQEAGFSLVDAERLQRSGRGEIVHRAAILQAPVTK